VAEPTTVIPQRGYSARWLYAEVATTAGGVMAPFDVDAFIERFRQRALAVRERGIPPLEGQARRQYVEAAEQDHTDFSLVGAASWSVDGPDLVLRIPLGR